MGLDITSKSKLEYSFSYSGIHYIRFMAYRTLGGEKVYLEWHHMHYEEPYYFNVQQPPIHYDHDEADQKLDDQFPNLVLHSDCEGSYTLKGKINPKNGGWRTGNSKGLLNELERIKTELPPKHDATVTYKDWFIFTKFYKLVKDIVQNYDGRLEFH